MLKKRNNGMWMVDVKLEDGTRVRKSLGTTDKNEAQKKMAEILSEIMDEAPAAKVEKKPKAATMTLRDAFAKAMRDYKPWKSSASPKTIEENFKKITASTFFSADDDLTAITYDKVSDYAAHMSDEKKSGSTINQRLSLLSVLLTQAATRWGYRQLTPFKMPRVAQGEGRRLTLSKEDEENMIATLKAGTRRHCAATADVVVILLATGCRLSEALRMAPSHVRWEHNQVTIWKTKNGKARSVPMSQAMKDILEARKDIATHDTFFPGLTVDAVDKCWAWAREQLGVTDPEFVIHALRHTRASRLAAAGKQAFKIQALLGHTQIATTEKYVTIYGNELQDLLEVD